MYTPGKFQTRTAAIRSESEKSLRVSGERLVKNLSLYLARVLLPLALVPQPAVRAQAPSSVQSLDPRARDLGVPFDGTPGPLNAITDVPGVEVGFKTLIAGEGRLVVGKGPVRTGVTAILPRGKFGVKSVFAGYFAGNGNGDMTGTHWVEENGVLETPILITNTGPQEARTAGPRETLAKPHPSRGTSG